MRYYDLRVWREVSQKEQDKASQEATSRNVVSKSPTTQPGKTNYHTLAGRTLLHLSSYLIHDQENMEYKPGGSPQTGVFDPGALEIEFQITETDFSSPIGGEGGAYITIRGVDPATIGQASSLQGATLRLNAGMGHGLPLSKPRAGTILYGTVQNAFANWEGTDLSLTLFVTGYPFPFSQEDQEAQAKGLVRKERIFTYQCKRGQPLKPFIEQALKSLSPGTEVIFDVKNDPSAPEDFQGVCKGSQVLFWELADMWSKSTGGSKLSITASDGKFVCSEKRDDKKPTAIALEELIGQPTWNGAASITICCPLRPDIKTNDLVTLPDDASLFGIVEPNNGYVLPDKYKRSSLFSGEFTVNTVNHLGQFRSADGQQWMTTLDCIPTVSL